MLGQCKWISLLTSRTSIWSSTTCAQIVLLEYFYYEQKDLARTRISLCFCPWKFAFLPFLSTSEAFWSSLPFYWYCCPIGNPLYCVWSTHSFLQMVATKLFSFLPFPVSKQVFISLSCSAAALELGDNSAAWGGIVSREYSAACGFFRLTHLGGTGAERCIPYLWKIP